MGPALLGAMQRRVGNRGVAHRRPATYIRATIRLHLLKPEVAMSTSTSPKNFSSTDRIQKTMVLKAARSKVWRALTDSKQFGQWFQANVGGPFVAGQRASGPI